MPIIDLHCDTIMALMLASRNNENKNLFSNDLMLSIEKMNKGNYMAQCLAMFVPFTVDNPYKLCKDMLVRAKEEVEENSKYIRLAYNTNDIINNYNENKLSAILTIEEGGVVQNSLEKLEEFYELGVRMICLNWNFENGIGHPNYGLILPSGKPDFTVPNTENGLTEFGFEMIKRMNELGMIIDVSHLSDKGFYDCISVSKYPIIASHSNSRVCCNHVRNLTDDMIIKLNENGGIMGMNYCPQFLNNDDEIGKKTVQEVVRHIKYIKELVGVDIIALGSDFDGISNDIELNNAGLLNDLLSALRAEGFTDEEIDKITYKNVLRVFNAVLR